MPLYPSHKMTKRSQSSIEFMILVAFILFGFLAFFAFIYGSISDNVIKTYKKLLKGGQIKNES